MFRVLRWQTGQIPFAQTVEELEELRWTNPHEYFRNRFFEPLYKHVIAMQTELNWLMHHSPFVSAAVDLSRCKRIAWVHDMGEPTAGKMQTPGFELVDLEHYYNPYGFFYEEPGVSDAFYVDIPFGIASPEERRYKKDKEYSSFLQAVDEDVALGFIPHSVAQSLVNHLDEYEAVLADDGTVSPHASQEGLLVKYIDRYCGAKVGLSGPFDFRLRGYEELPDHFHAYVTRTINDILKFHSALREKLTSLPARQEFDGHLNLLLREFVTYGYPITSGTQCEDFAP